VVNKIDKYLRALKRTRRKYNPAWSCLGDKTGVAAHVNSEGNLTIEEGSLDPEYPSASGVVIPRSALKSFASWLIELTKE